MDSPQEAQREIRRWFQAALDVVDPRAAVVRTLSLEDGVISVDSHRVPVTYSGRVVVIAIGKAACPLARGARDVLGDIIDRGIILTKYGHVDAPVDGFQIYEASHPTPDQAGLDATAAILDAVQGLSENDLVIALISGGGSALLELPREGVSLEDMQAVTSRLMHAGAGIHDLNTVRKALSQVKGGGLRARIGEARCVTLLLSDVLGNDPAVIASGPTVRSSSGPRDALAVLRQFGVEDEIPERVRNTLLKDPRSLPVPDVSRDVVTVIADNERFIREVAARAEAGGMRVSLELESYDGDAAVLGRHLVETLDTLPDDVDVFVRGGEATVTVTGDGVGGRNTEMALAAAIALDGDEEWVVASLASDGDDGNSKAAGAIVDGGTVRRAREVGIDAEDALRRNDSASVFRVSGGLVETGPTGTNVNDVYVAARCRQSQRKDAR